MMDTGQAVHFGADFVRRLERLVVRLAGARERREGAGPAGLLGSGEEFVGYRPYRPGEDLRQLDWNLYARLDRPYVRVTRREAGEDWSVLVDRSASMGVGEPSKLQLASEVAVALAAVGLRVGARTQVVLSGGVNAFRLTRKTELAGLLGFLEGTRAEGDAGLAALCAGAARLTDVPRVFLVGDFLDLEPADLLALVRRRRELSGVQLLAAVEHEPPAAGAVEWHDPEDGARVRVALDDERVRARYERALDERIEAFAHGCARHGVRFGTWDSTTPFERVVERLFGTR